MTTRDDLTADLTAEQDQESSHPAWVRRHWRVLTAIGVIALFATGATTAALSGSGDDPEQTYLQLVREDIFPTGDDDELLDIGYGICELYDDGYTWVEVIAVLTGTLTGRDAGALSAYATGTLCPEHLDKSPNR